MRCDEVRERLSLRGREDLPPDESRELEVHLESCSSCARAAARTAESLRLLRAAWAPEIDDPEEEEMVELIAATTPASTTTRRRPWVLAAAAAILAVAAILVFRGLRGEPDGPRTFASGPDVPPAEAVVVEPPALLVPTPAVWDGTTDRLLLAVKGDRVEARASYEVAGESDRRKLLAREEELPAPRPDAYPSVVIAADADEPWRATLERAFQRFTTEGMSRRDDVDDLYLAGRAPDGSLGVLPLQTEIPDIVRALGYNLTPADLRLEEAVLELRVTRVPDGAVRYRWGRFPTERRPNPRPAGDVTIPADLVDAGSVGDLAPLRQFLRVQGKPSTEIPWRSCVLLQADRKARYVDVLRAVECADGDPTVYFLPDPHPSLEYSFRLPVPSSRWTSVLREFRYTGVNDPAVVNVLDSGEAVYRRMVIDPQTFDPSGRGRTGLLVRADPRAPWSACAGFFRRRPATRPLLFAYDEEPDLPQYQVLDFSLDPGTPPESYGLERGPDGELRLPFPHEKVLDRRLRLAVPDDAKVGEVILLALEIRGRGGWVTFE